MAMDRTILIGTQAVGGLAEFNKDLVVPFGGFSLPGDPYMATGRLLGFGASQSEPAPNSPAQSFFFDTIGQPIVRAGGLVRTALQIIWIEGLDFSGDTLPAGTTAITWAGAAYRPIDPFEGGTVVGLWDGGDLIFNPDEGGAIIPETWDDAEEAAQLLVSLAQAKIYPGTESQEPEPLIVTDKGASRVPAFRGLRYIVFPEYPVKRGRPNVSFAWKSKGKKQPPDPDFPDFGGAVGMARE